MTERAATCIAREVHKYIQNNGLRAGDRLPTHDRLAGELAVGVGLLREGLGILEQQGLIATRRRGGTVVSDPPVSALGEPLGWHLDARGYTFEDLVHARATLEGAIATQAAQCRSARDLLAMLDAIEAANGFTTQSPEAEIADRQFHLAVLQAASNPVLEIVGQLIVEQFNRKHADDLHSDPAGMRLSLAEHRAIYGEIEQRNSAAARSRMRRHILRQLTEPRNHARTDMGDRHGETNA